MRLNLTGLHEELNFLEALKVGEKIFHQEEQNRVQ